MGCNCGSNGDLTIDGDRRTWVVIFLDCYDIMQVIDEYESLSIILISVEFGVFVHGIGLRVFNLADYNCRVAILDLKWFVDELSCV